MLFVSLFNPLTNSSFCLAAITFAVNAVELSTEYEFTGGNDNEIIIGEDEPNVLHGGPGNDILNGEKYDDKLYGGPGNNKLHGWGGRDILYA